MTLAAADATTGSNGRSYAAALVLSLIPQSACLVRYRRWPQQQDYVLNTCLAASINCRFNVNNQSSGGVQRLRDTGSRRYTESASRRYRWKLPMLVLGYAGHRRHGWKENAQGKLASRLKYSRRHPTIFDAITSFGD